MTHPAAGLGIGQRRAVSGGTFAAVEGPSWEGFMGRTARERLAKLLDGALDSGVLFAETVDLELVLEVVRNVRTGLLATAEVGPLFRIDANLGGMGVSDTQDDLCHNSRCYQPTYVSVPNMRNLGL